MSILFLEGQARVGKTTTAQLLRKLFAEKGRDSVVQKFSKSDKSRHHVLVGQIMPFAVDDDTIHIIDRGITTELVYSSLYKRPIDIKLFSYLDSLFARLPVANMLLCATQDVLVARHEQTKRPYEGHIGEISDLFDQHWEMSDIYGCRYNTSTTAPDDIAFDIMTDFLYFLEQKKG